MKCGSAVHYRSDAQTPLETVLMPFDTLLPCEQVDDHVLVHPGDGSFRAGERPALKPHMGRNRESDVSVNSVGKASRVKLCAIVFAGSGLEH